MAEKIRPPHLASTTLPSQQPLLVPPSSLDGGQHAIPVPKFQQVPALHSHSPSQPDLALHTRPTSSTVSGTGGGIIIENPGALFHIILGYYDAASLD